MIRIRDKETGQLIGWISEKDLQFLIDNLEEEWEEDTDYYLTTETLELLRQKGASESLMNLLEQALGTREAIEIQWSRA